jgi:hypothetical protein
MDTGPAAKEGVAGPVAVEPGPPWFWSSARRGTSLHLWAMR